MPVALGFLETNSLIGAVEASDVMAKTSNIVLLGKEVDSRGSTTIKIAGEKESVENAINSGSDAVKNLELNVSSHIIVDFDEQVLSILPEIRSLYYYLKKNSKKKIKKSLKRLNVELEEESAEKLEPERPEPELIKTKKTKIKKPKAEKTRIEKPVVENTKPKSENIAAADNVSEEDSDFLIIKRPEKTSKKEKPNRKTVEEKRPEIKERKRKSYINDTIERLRLEALGLNKPEKKKPVKKEIKKTRTIKKVKKNGDSNLKSMNVHQLRKLARDTKNFPIHGRDISKANREVLLQYFDKLK
jgi:ethanolamine utilization protein EutM